MKRVALASAILAALFVAALVLSVQTSRLQAQAYGGAFVVPNGSGGSSGGGLSSNEVVAIVEAVATNSVIVLGKSVFVSTNGNDTTGLRLRLDKPFRTVSAGLAATLSNDTLHVYAGDYSVSNICKNGVNMQGYGAPTLVYTNSTNFGRGEGIIDDRFDGPLVMSIKGFNIRWSAGIPGTNAGGQANPDQIATNVVGAIVITNAASQLTYSGDLIEYQVLYPHFQGTAAVRVNNCRSVITDISRIVDINLTTNYYLGQDSDDEPVLVASQATAYYWQTGEAHFKGSRAEAGLYYAWWEAVETSPTGNVWLTLDFGTTGTSRGYYTSSLFTSQKVNWKSWLDIKESRGEVNIGGGGKHYIRAEKMGHTSDLINVTDYVQLWVSAQKLSSGSKWLICDGAGSIVDLNVMTYEDTSGSMSVGMQFKGTNTTTLHGGTATVTNGTVILMDIGTPRIEVNSMKLVSIQGSPVTANTNGLTLKNTTLVGTNTQFGITSTVNATNTVKIMGSYSRTPETNKVLYTVGPWTVDTDVQ